MTPYENFKKEIEKNVVDTYGNMVSSQILEARYEHLMMEKRIKQSYISALEGVIEILKNEFTDKIDISYPADFDITEIDDCMRVEMNAIIRSMRGTRDVSIGILQKQIELITNHN